MSNLSRFPLHLAPSYPGELAVASLDKSVKPVQRGRPSLIRDEIQGANPPSLVEKSHIFSG
jgi:hypothetical protein